MSKNSREGHFGSSRICFSSTSLQLFECVYDSMTSFGCTSARPLVHLYDHRTRNTVCDFVVVS